MIEIIWHGRGGQGAFTAARLLGAAASISGENSSLAFPTFGPERRGAPMRAFTKIDRRPIGNRSEVKQADYVVYLDETLLAEGWDKELKDTVKNLNADMITSPVVLVNSKKHFNDPRIKSIDASGIATDILGRNIPNTVFLGLICAICDALSIEDAREAIRHYMPEKLHEKNLAIIDKVANAKEALNKKGGDNETIVASNHGSNSSESRIAINRQNSPEGQTTKIAFKKSKIVNGPSRPDCVIPKLHSEAVSPKEFAHNTCWQAGWLTTKNAGWRTFRPKIDQEKCTGCLKCYMDCPDGCIFKMQESRTVGIDLDFCKGCAMCAEACKFNAIEMIAERSAE